MSIDWSKPIVTRAGLTVRVMARDMACRNYPVLALVKQKDGTEITVQYTADGRPASGIFTSHPADLVNVKPDRISYVNVYENGFVSPGFATLEDANHAARKSHVGDRVIYKSITRGTTLVECRPLAA